MNPVVHAEDPQHHQPWVEIAAEDTGRDALFDDRKQRLAIGVGIGDNAVRFGKSCKILTFAEQQEDLGVVGQIFGESA